MSDQDSVRLLAVEGCAALGKFLEPQDCVAHILPVIVTFSQVNKCVNMIGFSTDELYEKAVRQICISFFILIFSSLSRISPGVCVIWLQISSMNFVKL